VQLQPAELGRVQISVTSDASGLSSVQVSADRPETLALLQNDQPELARALDQAGIPSTGRTVTFQLSGDAAGGASSAANAAPLAGMGGAQPGLDATHSASDALGGGSAPSGASLSGGLGSSNAAPNAVGSAESGFANALSGSASGASGGGSGSYHPPPQSTNAQAGNASFGGQSGGSGQGGGGRTGHQGWAGSNDLLLNDAADLINDADSGWISNGLDIIA